MKWIFLIAIGTLFSGCQSSAGESNTDENTDKTELSAHNTDSNVDTKFDLGTIEEEIEALNTSSRMITFQRLIIKTDMEVHKEQTNALQNHGVNSAEYKGATAIVEQTNRENLARTVGFVSKYGISDNQSVGRMQADAMWLVMTHNSDIEVYQKLFPAFEESWKMEYLDPTAFAAFLQDYYYLKNGERIEMKNPYRTEDEIKTLLKALK